MPPLGWLNTKPGSSEHYVTRYVMLILQLFFASPTWTLVPQFWTRNNEYPDLALEWFDEGIFISKIHVEFKSTQIKSPSVAIKQLMDSLTQEYGPSYPSRGHFIGIQGKNWLILGPAACHCRTKITAWETLHRRDLGQLNGLPS